MTDYLELISDASAENQLEIINELKDVNQSLADKLNIDLEDLLNQLSSNITGQTPTPVQVINDYSLNDMTANLSLATLPMVGKSKFTCFYEVMGNQNSNSPITIRLEYESGSITVNADPMKRDTTIRTTLKGGFAKDGITIDNIKLTLVTPSTDLYISKVVLTAI